MARSHVLLGAGDTAAELTIRRIKVTDLKDSLRAGLADFNAMPTHAIFLLLREINAQGTAVLMATHDVAMIQRSNLRFLELDHGELVHDGTDVARLLADMRGRR